MFRPVQIALILVLLWPLIAVGDAPRHAPTVGDRYLITKSYETSSETSDGSSGSSRGSDRIVESLVGVSKDGLEFEYDLPGDMTPEARARSWQFPARVFKPTNGTVQLLNRSEVESRVENWLKAGGMTREECGKWIFTWNAFRIECDPESIVQLLDSFDLSIENLSDGASYVDSEAMSPGLLRKNASGEGDETYSVALEIDQEMVRRARAESDVVVGELLNKPVTLEEALAKRAKEEISGTILVTIKADHVGNAWRRTRVAEVETRLADGNYKRERISQIVERHQIHEP